MWIDNQELKSIKDVEIEIQVQLEKSKPLHEFLEKEAKFIGETIQVDEYFTPAHKNFIAEKPVNEWLRLRKTKKGCTITYKNWHRKEDGSSTHADEYETAFTDIDQMEKILSALNMRRLIKYEKLHKSYLYKDYEISLDTIEGLGDYVEVEYKGKNAVDPEKITQEMISFLKSLDVGEITRNYVGYTYMLLFPGEGKFEIL